MSRALALAIAGLVALTSVARADGAPREQLLLHGSLRLGGLEEYPIVGLAAGAHRRVGRFRLGGSLNAYAPKDVGAARRSTYTADLEALLLLVESRRVNLTLDLGLGLAVFHDGFEPRSYFDDETQVAPGALLGLGLEIAMTERWLVVANLRGRYYAADRVSDHEWLELGVGVRWRFR
jgi:hypothetical protein